MHLFGEFEVGNPAIALQHAQDAGVDLVNV
jgi:hypothetical protein